MLDRVFDVRTLIKMQLYSLIGAYIDALPAAAAVAADAGAIIQHVDGIHETNTLRAFATTQTIIIHQHIHTWQTINLCADLGRDIR